MTVPDPDPESERAERHRKRLDALGDTSTDRADDDRDEGWSDRAGSEHDDELRRDVPPHHG